MWRQCEHPDRDPPHPLAAGNASPIKGTVPLKAPATRPSTRVVTFSISQDEAQRANTEHRLGETKCEFLFFFSCSDHLSVSAVEQLVKAQLHAGTLPAQGCRFLSQFQYLSKSRAFKRDTRPPKQHADKHTEDNVFESRRGFHQS